MRWPCHARLGRTAAGAAKAGQPDRDPAEQRRNRVLAIVLHPAGSAATPALWPPDGVNAGLRGDDLLLDAGQEPLAFGQGQPQAGQVGEIIRPDDLQDISAVFFSLSTEAHQSHDPGHVVSTSTGKPA